MSIDVIIPVFNRERFIESAVESVLKQSRPVDRIIVVNDGSTDGSESVIQKLMRDNAKIEYVPKERGGPSSARNAGLKQSKGELVAFLDSDDTWYPEKLETQLAVLAESSLQTVGLVYCGYDLINDEGLPIDNIPLQTPKSRGRIFDRLLGENVVISSASGALVRRRCFDHVGLFDEKLLAAEDWDMWLRIAQFYEFDFTPERLVSIRFHPTNLQKNSRQMLMNEALLFEKWIGVASRGHPKVLRDWRAMVATKVNLQREVSLGAVQLALSRRVRMVLFRYAFGSVRLHFLLVALRRYLLGLSRDVFYRSKALFTDVSPLIRR